MTLSDGSSDASDALLKTLASDTPGPSLLGSIVPGPVFSSNVFQTAENAQAEKIPPTEYRVDPWYVYTQIAGRDVKLELRADADMAGRELLGIVALMLGRVRGNTLVYLVEHDLLKHFEEVPLPQMDDVAQEEIKRTAKLHDKAAHSYQYQLYRHMQRVLAAKTEPNVAAAKRAALLYGYSAKSFDEALHVPDPLPDRSPPKSAGATVVPVNRSEPRAAGMTDVIRDAIDRVLWGRR